VAAGKPPIPKKEVKPYVPKTGITDLKFD